MFNFSNHLIYSPELNTNKKKVLKWWEQLYTSIKSSYDLNLYNLKTKISVAQLYFLFF